MNETINMQLNHRTIREFDNRAVEDEVLEELFEVFNRAPSSTGLQQCSIIRVTDQKIKDEIMKVSTQKYLAKCPELLIFIVDIYRNSRIAIENGFKDNSYRDMDRFFQGFTDALVGAQNMVNAIESLGLGAVYFGSILNDYDRICEILKLPELTFPVVGLGFGYPMQNPQIKPKMPVNLKIFENKYKVFDNYMDSIKGYDDEMTNYYDTRDEGRRSDCFSKQVVKKFEDIVIKRKDVLKSIAKQGFNVE
ncbi:nitroreductase family protein [Peptoniphilus sp. oral taxon 386]|uniref:nitroreductase family protein n=1 Tax=Peptoniphilus sp. oral taxon 386 TaxID=652713 RepID=UPI0001DA9EE0|nr:nitroreductase family protein [Peptoniphilus sp. oral taxon 386]EFI41526.1 nitroreductase family protein [Peptoniphilus sp. oral taxon 386 str. F0131]